MSPAPIEHPPDSPPVCDYEGADYQTRFWEQGGRTYEDQVEAIALRRLLAGEQGEWLVEIGAGAGRNTPRYQGYRRVVLVDYSRSMLRQAQARLGRSERYVYVAANAYHLPFASGFFDAATMIRVLHHMAEPQRVLTEVRRVLRDGGVFILEFASKRHLKAILRYVLRRQAWSPFTLEPVEFAPLHFDFHPRAVETWLRQAGFRIERRLTVSHFRHPWLKRLVPVRVLVALDALAQLTGDWWQLTPSVFVKARAVPEAAEPAMPRPRLRFRCPVCGHEPLEETADRVSCPQCGRAWAIHDGLYDFKTPIHEPGRT
ncbi:MAG: methyltransferase domain-containing protein [Chloroflexi bacterium]|nr:methyltransferase domain-containing protein [Chloroflexota bacterium]